MPKLIDNLYMKDSNDTARQIADTDGNLYQADTKITATAAEVNQVCDGVSANVTSTNLSTLTDSVTSTSLHKHVLADGATDVTATAAEVNTLDGITATTAELNKLSGVAGPALATEAVGDRVEYGREAFTNSGTTAANITVSVSFAAAFGAAPYVTLGAETNLVTYISTTASTTGVSITVEAVPAATTVYVNWMAIGQ